MILALLSGAAPAAADASAGRKLLEGKCGGCHAIERAGASPLAAAPALRDLGERYPPEALEEALAEGIITGHPDMPELVASPEEIDDIIAWLEQIQTRQ